MAKPEPQVRQTTSVNVTFEDIAGLKAAKRDLQEVVQFLKEPDRFQRLGSKVPRGVLLVGPPGTGKTLLARAVAGEAGVPFFSIGGSEFIQIFVGLGASRVRDLFRDANKIAPPSCSSTKSMPSAGRGRRARRRQRRARADAEPAAVGDGRLHAQRPRGRHRGHEPSRRPRFRAAPAWPLRSARARRSSRVGRPPAILDVHAKGKPVALDVNLRDVAQNTPGFSGADLADLVNEAAL